MTSTQSSSQDGGRRSCLTAVLVILAVILVMGLGLVGLGLLVGGGNIPGLGEGVGVIEITGIIESSLSTLESLNRFAESEGIKAVLIRVDSPGGVVGPTQEIYREILRVRNKKKVVVSMGSLAASGGLYIACAGDVVFANPATVTGSIGVIMQWVNFEDLMDKVGVDSVVVKSGKFKDLGSGSRTMTPEERALLQKTVDGLHAQFVRDVAESRGLDPEKVSEMADGRLFTGEEALSLGLVDKLGNFQDAVARVGQLAGLEGSPKLVYVEKEGSFLDRLIEQKTPAGMIPGWIRRPVSFQYLFLPGV